MILSSTVRVCSDIRVDTSIFQKRNYVRGPLSKKNKKLSQTQDDFLSLPLPNKKFWVRVTEPTSEPVVRWSPALVGH